MNKLELKTIFYSCLIALPLLSCAGTPEVRALNALNVVCDAYDIALVDMTVLFRSGRLSLPQAERFEVVRSIASPICRNQVAAGADALQTVENQLAAMAAIKKDARP